MKQGTLPAQGPVQLNIRALNGDEPHPDYGGWRNFLETLEVRDTRGEVTYYGSANCNYLLFPTGEVVQNFGFHGRRVMNEVSENGWLPVLEGVRQRLATLREMLRSNSRDRA